MFVVIVTERDGEASRSSVVTKGGEALKEIQPMTTDVSIDVSVTVEEQNDRSFEHDKPVVEIEEDPRGSKNHLLGQR